MIYIRSLYPKLRGILASWPLPGQWLYLNSVAETRFGIGLSHNGTDHSSQYSLFKQMLTQSALNNKLLGNRSHNLKRRSSFCPL